MSHYDRWKFSGLTDEPDNIRFLCCDCGVDLASEDTTFGDNKKRVCSLCGGELIEQDPFSDIDDDRFEGNL